MKKILSGIVIPCILILLIIGLALRDNSPRELNISFTPKQCVESLWEKYYKEGGVRFIKEPTEEELIRVYYSLKYNLDVGSIEKFEGDPSCEACEICNKGYYFKMKIDSKDLKIFLDEGWTKN